MFASDKNCMKAETEDIFPVYANLPYRLARLGTSLRIRGKLTPRKKEIIVFL